MVQLKLLGANFYISCVLSFGKTIVPGIWLSGVSSIYEVVPTDLSYGNDMLDSSLPAHISSISGQIEMYPKVAKCKRENCKCHSCL